jgi:hypothetical protein
LQYSTIMATPYAVPSSFVQPVPTLGEKEVSLCGLQDDTQGSLCGEGPCFTVRWKSNMDLSSIVQRKFYMQKREKKGCMGSCRRTWKLDVCQRRSVSLVRTDVSWTGEGTFFPLAN